MGNNPNLGIGPSGLKSAQEHLEGEDHEKEAAEEDPPMNEEGDPVGEDKSEEDVPDPDEVAGRGGQTVVTSHSEGYQDVEIQCGATSCVFNRQHNCEAGEVHISFNPNKGMRSPATQCDTYQTAPAGEE